MQPFQQFRLWARNAPVHERAVTGLAAIIAVALLGWLLVPEDGASSDEVTTIGDTTSAADAPAGAADPTSAEGTQPGATSPDLAPGDTTGTGAAAPTGGSGAGSGAATPGPQAASGGAAPAGGCTSPPGTATGITATEVRIGVALTEIVGPAANQLFAIPTRAEAKADFDAVIAGINKEGGVACRKVVARYYTVNPADESQMMALCRDAADDGLFAMIDTGAMGVRPAVISCLAQRKLPYFGVSIASPLQQQAYPYVFGFYMKEQVYRSTAVGLRDLGYFDPAKGFKKLGFIYRDCESAAVNSFRGWIREVVPDAQVTTYNVGCPTVFANEADLAQAVLAFKRAGVTHVITANFVGDIARFTSHAEQQSFRPRYGFPDENLLNVAEGSRSPNPDNIANAIAITVGRDAEHRTPGMTPTAGTQRCNAYYRAAGQPTVYEQPANAGHACDQLWMLQAALGKAPELSAAGLPVGLQRAKSIDFSFPQGPNDFSGNRVTTGGQFWRAAQFLPSCKCWQVSQREFRKGS